MTVIEVLDYLRKKGSRKNVEGMKRFGIVAPNAFGVNAPAIRKLAKQIGTDHSLAQHLWKTGYHEARIIAALIADPEKTNQRLMEHWVNDFDNWAVCDTCCGELFDSTPFAIAKAKEWCSRRKEFVKRAGFVMVAALAVHDKALTDNVFTSFFPLIQRESNDDRNFVRKAVNWALRQIGKRNSSLHSRALKIAETLSSSPDRTARWIGKDAVRDLTSRSTQRRLQRRKIQSER